jgi:hypothetical protein
MGSQKDTAYTSVRGFGQLVYDAAILPLIRLFVERLDYACFICFCPLMSIIVGGFLSALLSLETALVNSKRGLSKFHTMALRLVGIKVDDDMLPDMMMWREVETAAAESEHSAGLRI